MTAIALMICRFKFTRLSYHTDHIRPRRSATSAQPRGWLKDKYGLSWQIVAARFFELIADPDTEKTARVTRAMFGMTKFDIAALERAYAGA